MDKLLCLAALYGPAGLCEERVCVTSATRLGRFVSHGAAGAALQRRAPSARGNIRAGSLTGTTCRAPQPAPFAAISRHYVRCRVEKHPRHRESLGTIIWQ